MQNTHISLKNLTKSFKQPPQPLAVLADISYQFTAGTAYAIMGVSGSGKSTLMHLIAGIDRPDSGTIMYNDRNLLTISDKHKQRFYRETIGILFQQPYLIRELTSLENVMLPGLIAQKNQSFCEQHARRLLEAVGLSNKILAKPRELSGGQQQRAALARALFNNPAFLLADEPTGNLDSQTASSIIDLIKQYQEQNGMGLIISTHDEQVAHRMDTILTLTNGTLRHHPSVTV